MTAHAKLGASGSKKWMNCHAALPAEHHYPNKESSYAAEGTVAHMVAERAVGEGRKASDFIGLWGDGSEKHKDEGLYAKAKRRTEFEFEVTDEMARAVQVYVDAVNNKVFELKLLGHDPIVAVETGFSLSKVMGRDDMFGTNDTSVFVPRVYLGVFDYKHGRGEVVEVDDNSQLKYYALGKLIEVCWNDLFDGFDETLMPEEIELFVGQPRAPHNDGPIRSWKIDPTALIEDFVAEMKEDAEAIDRLYAALPFDIDKMTSQGIMDALPIEEFSAGSWCKWCKAKANCKALYAEAQRAMTKDFGDDGLSLEELGDMIDDKTKDLVTKKGKNAGAPNAKAVNAATKAVATELAKVNIDMDGEKLRRLLNAANLLEMVAKAIRQQAYNQVTQGAKVPGYKLVRQGTKRRWLEGPKEEIVETLGLFGFDGDALYKPRELKSFTDIEELSKEAAALVEGLTEQPEGALVLAKETDKRPAVVPSAADAFEGDELDASEFE